MFYETYDYSVQVVTGGHQELSNLDLTENINSWVHLALIFDTVNFSVKMFVNGTDMPVNAAANWSQNISPTNVRTLALGKEYVTDMNPQSKNMILDELILCDKPLSENEISFLIV